MPPKPEQELNWGKMLDVAMTAPGNVGNTYNRFYPYSFLNQMLLLSQGILEPVATYKRWQSVGRQVLKGSKAKEIVRPIVIEKKDAAGDPESRMLKFKRVRCIFGYSETSGDELPPVETPRWELKRALGSLAIEQQPFQLFDGNTQGYSYERTYAINPVAVNPLKTTFHEVGHIVLGHTSVPALEEYQAHRGVKEFQAEATAYLSMNELELLDDETASRSRGYIQTWLGDERPPDTAIRQVFSATDRILKAGRPDLEGGDDE